MLCGMSRVQHYTLYTQKGLSLGSSNPHTHTPTHIHTHTHPNTHSPTHTYIHPKHTYIHAHTHAKPNAQTQQGTRTLSHRDTRQQEEL